MYAQRTYFLYRHVIANELLLLDIWRLKQNIIFESNVLDWLQCSATCVHTRFCVGYNVKNSSTDGQIKCQLTHTANQTFRRISTEDNDWTFYKIAGKKMVRLY